MSESSKRIFFLCAHRSIRELLAASLLAAQTHESWDIWIASATFAAQDVALVRQVLDEIHLPLLLSLQTAEPSSGLFWDKGIVLCSGAADQ